MNVDLIKKLILKYPNDYDLGENYRKDCKFDDLSLSYPNDFDLGSFLREKYKN